MDYDELVKILGKGGRFELLIVLLLSVPGLFNAFSFMSVVFVSGTPDHWCSVPELAQFNLTQEQEKRLSIPGTSSCSMYDRNYSSWTGDDVVAAIEATISPNLSTVNCRHGWEYDTSQYTSTVVSQWDLVCDYQWLKATAASVDYAGIMAGVIVFGLISDRFGRKPSFCISATLKSVTMLATAFSPNYTIFVILRFFVAAFSTATSTTCFVTIVETVAPSWRVHAGLGFMYAWGFGCIALAGMAYLIRDWFTLQLVIALTSFVNLAYIWFIPESPRWLYTHNQAEKGDQIVRMIGKFNRVELPDQLHVTVKETVKGNPLDIIRSSKIRYISFNLFFNWAVNNMVYYGLSLNTSNLGGDDYINFLISGVVEIPAYALCQLATTFLGRRWSLAGTMVVGGVALLAILTVHSDTTWLVITLAMIGKFSITTSFSIVYVVTAELYPTTLRTIGMGASSFSSRVGGIVAPYLAEMGNANRILPPVIFGVASILAGLLALLLPETRGRHLPDTLGDCKRSERGYNLCGGCVRPTSCLQPMGRATKGNVYVVNDEDEATELGANVTPSETMAGVAM